MLTEQAVYERINTICQDVFDDDTLTVCATTTANDVADWDSLEHIRLIAAVEREFGMRFKMGEVSSMKDVGEMASIVLERATK